MSSKYATLVVPLVVFALLLGVAVYVRWDRSRVPVHSGPGSPPLANGKPPSADQGPRSIAAPSDLPTAAQASARPDWALGSTIDFNDFFRREQVRRTSSVQLEWTYANAYATDPGSLGANAQAWLESTYAGRAYDQIRGGFSRDPGKGSVVYRMNRTAPGTLFVRKEMTPLSL